MKNIFYTILVIIALSSIGFSMYLSFGKIEDKKQDSTTISIGEGKLIAEDLPEFKIKSDWNVNVNEKIVGLESGFWAELYDGARIRNILLHKEQKSIEMYMDSAGPSGFGFPSCYEGDIVVGKNYFATRYLPKEDFGPKIIFLNKKTHSLKGDSDFEDLKTEFLKTSDSNSENLAYCEKNILDYTTAEGIINQFNNKAIDKMFIGSITSINDFENSKELLEVVDSISGIKQKQI